MRLDAFYRSWLNSLALRDVDSNQQFKHFNQADYLNLRPSAAKAAGLSTRPRRLEVLLFLWVLHDPDSSAALNNYEM